ncbi:MAG: CsgG/HfaB family protein [Myxococcota bacterium]
MRILAHAAALLTLLLVAVPARAARSVAVLPLAKASADEAYDGLGTALAGMLMTDLSQVPELQLVERERLGDILNEIALGDTGYLDPESAQRLGKGVGAEMVVTGSFSVIDGALLMDTRMVAVESGAVLKAASATGPLTDFVSVEKEVVEGLIEGLSVKLSMAVRRRLLVQTPTESVDALAQYGRGIEATDRGNLDQARRAFEQAIVQDPTFALAARALSDLKARVKSAQAVERERTATSRDRAVRAALETLPSELDRKRRFEDTPASLVDLGIRWVLLQREARACALFSEQRHYLERTRGRVGDWIETLPGRRRLDRFEAASDLYDARGRELGLVGPDTLFGTRPGEIIHQAVYLVSTPRTMLLFGSLTPEKFGSTLARTLTRCIEPPLQEATWVELTGLADKMGILDDPISTTMGEGPSPVTVGVSMRLFRAWLRATNQGADDAVIAMTEAELARYPEGAPGRREVLRAIENVIGQGERYEARRAARLGLPEAALVGLARAIADQAPKPLNLDDPLCSAIVELQADAVPRPLERLDGASERQRESRVDALGYAVAPVLRMGCVSGSSPVGFERARSAVRDAAALRHPAGLDDPDCSESVRRFLVSLDRPATSLDAQARAAVGWWQSVHRKRTRRCLLAPQQGPSAQQSP